MARGPKRHAIAEKFPSAEISLSKPIAVKLAPGRLRACDRKESVRAGAVSKLQPYTLPPRISDLGHGEAATPR